MMNEDVPFFINIKRRQTADSYFEIGRTQEKVRKFLIESRNSRAELSLSCKNQEEEHTSVGFYGVSRYLSLEPDPGEEDALERDFIEIDEDVQFANTSAFSLFWMTFKRIALSIGEHLSIKNSSSSGAANDPEGNVVQHEKSNTGEVRFLVDPSLHDPRITQSKIIYGDVNYLIQKFRMDLKCGSLDVALFSVEFPGSHTFKFDSTDLQAYVISPDCGSFVWIENGKASAIFMTKSSTDFFGNVMEWFRKILSDMTLADSVMIGHPYYWHATVRRRLTRVMRYLKRLYRTLALKRKNQEHGAIRCGEAESTTTLEVICPKEISKIIINEQPSENLEHSSSTYEKLNTMMDRLVQKWLQYQRNLEQSYTHSVQDVSRTWATNNPQAVNRNSGNFLESVTFLNFLSSATESQSETPQANCLPCHTNAIGDVNNNKNQKYGNETESSCAESSENECVQIEGCHSRHHSTKTVGGNDQTKIRRRSTTSIEIEEPEVQTSSEVSHCSNI